MHNKDLWILRFQTMQRNIRKLQASLTLDGISVHKSYIRKDAYLKKQIIIDPYSRY